MTARDDCLKAAMLALEDFCPADLECLFDMAAAVVDALQREGLLAGTTRLGSWSERVRLTFEWDSQSAEQDEALCDKIADLAWTWLDGYDPFAEGFTPKGKIHPLPTIAPAFAPGDTQTGLGGIATEGPCAQPFDGEPTNAPAGVTKLEWPQANRDGDEHVELGVNGVVTKWEWHNGAWVANP